MLFIDIPSLDSFIIILFLEMSFDYCILFIDVSFLHSCMIILFLEISLFYS